MKCLGWLIFWVMLLRVHRLPPVLPSSLLKPWLFAMPVACMWFAIVTEHMLFLGTEKYPDENSFTAFLNAHGGGTNAYTSTENTNFHFDITPAHLEPALDRLVLD